MVAADRGLDRSRGGDRVEERGRRRKGGRCWRKRPLTSAPSSLSYCSTISRYLLHICPIVCSHRESTQYATESYFTQVSDAQLIDELSWQARHRAHGEVRTLLHVKHRTGMIIGHSRISKSQTGLQEHFQSCGKSHAADKTSRLCYPLLV
eukprot:532754-Rhodomonas_salina.1